MATATNNRFTSEDVLKAAERSRLQPGWYRWVCVDAEQKEPSEPKYNLCTITSWQPLTNPNDANSKTKPSVRLYVTYPLRNENVEGHVAPNTAGLLTGLVRALFPDEIPEMPMRDKASGKLMYNGDEIEKADEDEKRAEVMNLVFEKLDYLEQHPAEFIDQAVYAEAVYKDGSDWPSLEKFSHELPEGKTLVEAVNGSFFSKSGTNGKSEPAKMAPKGAAKAAPKAAAKPLARKR